MNKLWIILPLMLGCNSAPTQEITDASNNGSTDSGYDSGSGSNSVGLGATLPEAGNASSAGPAAGVSCPLPQKHGRWHRRRHHHCP